MSDLVRKQLYISRKQDAILKKKAAELGMTEAQIVREALDNQLESLYFPRNSLQVWNKEREFIKSLMASTGNTQERDRTWKREDLYER